MRRRSALRVRPEIPRSCRHLKIVLLDDDPTFRTALEVSLRQDGHEVDAYASPASAPPAGLVDAQLVITDQMMAPGDLSGLEFADAFHAAHPDVPVVIVTSGATGRLDAAVATRSFLHLRRKPVDYDELHALMHRLAG